MCRKKKRTTAITVFDVEKLDGGMLARVTVYGHVFVRRAHGRSSSAQTAELQLGKE